MTVQTDDFSNGLKWYNGFLFIAKLFFAEMRMRKFISDKEIYVRNSIIHSNIPIKRQIQALLKRSEFTQSITLTRESGVR